MESQINVGDQNTQQVGQNPPSQPIINSNKPKINYLIVGVVILVGFIIFGVGGCYLGKKSIEPSQVTTGVQNKQTQVPLATSTPAETANWKTYTNEKYKFSLRYPQNFYYKDINQTNTSSVAVPITWLLFFADLQRPTDQAHYPEIDIGFFQKSSTTTLDQWLKINTTTKDNYNNPDPEDKDKVYWGVKNVAKLSVSALPVIKFFASNGASTYQVVTLVDRGDKVFIVQSVITPLGQIDDKIVDQIISTFKFTPENSILGELKTTDVLVQDGSYYGPPFDPDLYQLAVEPSHYLFAKSDTVNLKQYLGKRIKVHYREVKGIVMGEQQLVVVESVE